MNFVFSVPQTEFRLHRNFVFMADFRLTFRLRTQFELQLLASNFVFKSFGISAEGGDETGTHFPGSMRIRVEDGKYAT